MTKPGSRVPVEILRNGKKQTVQVTVGEAPRDEKRGGDRRRRGAGDAAARPRWASRVQRSDRDTRKQLDLQGRARAW